MSVALHPATVENRDGAIEYVYIGGLAEDESAAGGSLCPSD